MDSHSLVYTTPSPLYFENTFKTRTGSFRILFHQTDPTNRPLARKCKQDHQNASPKQIFAHLPSLLKIKSQDFEIDNSTLLATMLFYADNGLVSEAQAIWDNMVDTCELPSVEIISNLIDAYAKWGCFNEVIKLLDQLSYSDFGPLHEVYCLVVSCFGKFGQLELMENVLKDMVLRGFGVDYATGNAFIRYYSIHGSLAEMEYAYRRVKRAGHIIDREGIRAVSLAYLRQRKLYRLGEFLREVGLKRRDVGNLIWNFLLLSYAADFKMKTLQREFLRMLDVGFCPDVTTFNIRALAFSRMALLWDLHLSLEHMKHAKVSCDLVTYGCVVDAYLDRRLGKNLDFALSKMNVDSSPDMLTDPLVFEVLGKGDFHSSAEAFLEFERRRKWTYRELISVHLRKQYRKNQIFWNY